MNKKIISIRSKIEKLKKSMIKEYEKIKKNASFQIEKGKVIFPEKIKEYHKKFKKNVFQYMLSAKVRHILSIPFIYSMIIPAIILDLFLLIYQYIAFPLYGIPIVKRKEYIVFDRKYLNYLNIVQKINCIYCSYVNGLFAYAVEVGGRTERYWCPIKHSEKIIGHHKRYDEFADYGDPEAFEEAMNNNKCFEKEKI